MKNYKKIEELLRPIYKHQYTNMVNPYNDQNHASPDTIIFHSGHEKYAFLTFTHAALWTKEFSFLM